VEEGRAQEEKKKKNNRGRGSRTGKKGIRNKNTQGKKKGLVPDSSCLAVKRGGKQRLGTMGKILITEKRRSTEKSC